MAFVKKHGLRRLRRSLGFLVLIGVWQLASHSSGASIAIPPPWHVARQMWQDLGSSVFWSQASVTLERGLIGLGVGSLVGVALGLLIGRVRVARHALEPVLTTLYPVPRIIFFPVLVVAIGIGWRSQSSVVAVECAFPMLFTTLAGIRNIQQDLLRSARNAQAGRVRMAGLTLCAALPSIMSGLRIVLPIMVTVVIAVQMLGGSQDGIGYMILADIGRFDPTDVIALAILTGIFGYLLYSATVMATRAIVFWERDVEL